jgi:hypothetical protein
MKGQEEIKYTEFYMAVIHKSLFLKHNAFNSFVSPLQHSLIHCVLEIEAYFEGHTLGVMKV